MASALNTNLRTKTLHYRVREGFLPPHVPMRFLITLCPVVHGMLSQWPLHTCCLSLFACQNISRLLDACVSGFFYLFLKQPACGVLKGGNNWSRWVVDV